MTASKRHSQNDDLERDTDMAIEACGGDARGAVRALLLANAFLEAELAQVMRTASSGYARRRNSIREPN